MTESITQKERQIFQDIAETGILESLKALSKLYKKDWSAFTQKFCFMTIEEARRVFPEKEHAWFGGDLYLEGDIAMSLLYIFPQESALHLTHFMTNQEETGIAPLTSRKTMAISEVSSILANTFLNVLANTLGVFLLPAPPKVAVDSRGALLEGAISRAGLKADYVITSELRLESDNLTMAGIFCLVLNTESLKQFVARIHASPAWTTQRWRAI